MLSHRGSSPRGRGRGRLQLQQEGFRGGREDGGSTQEWGEEGSPGGLASAPPGPAFELNGNVSVRAHLCAVHTHLCTQKAALRAVQSQVN